jgi:hypothetical protein
MITKQEESDIKHIVPNLRGRWPDELRPFSDLALARCYSEFAMSEEHGDNDERFPLWFEMIHTYEPTYKK